MHGIFKNHTLKVSCSCMDNIEPVILSQNRVFLNPEIAIEHSCSWRSRNEYTLQNSCLIPKIVYLADICKDANNEQKFHFGVSEALFKEHFGKDKKKKIPIGNTWIAQNSLSIFQI